MSSSAWLSTCTVRARRATPPSRPTPVIDEGSAPGLANDQTRVVPRRDTRAVAALSPSAWITTDLGSFSATKLETELSSPPKAETSSVRVSARLSPVPDKVSRFLPGVGLD